MDKRIELEMRGRKPSEIEELNLDNAKSTQVSGLTDQFTGLKYLSLINVGLTSLKGFPKLAALEKLEVSDNRLSGGFENLAGCPNLKKINLSGNKVKDIKSLEPLKDMANLKSIDLFDCPVASLDAYRKKLFEAIPQLKYVDGFDRDDNEEEESGESFGSEDEDEDEEDEEFDSEGDDEDEDEGADEDEEGAGEVDEDEDEEDEEKEGMNGNHKESEPAGKGKKRKHDDDDE